MARRASYRSRAPTYWTFTRYDGHRRDFRDGAAAFAVGGEAVSYTHLSRLQFEAIALQLPGQTAVHGEEGDEAGLDRVIDVGTSFENARDGIERAVELGLPAMRFRCV